MQPISYARHQFPPEVIRHATWLYLRFTLSYRDVEELLAERGIETSYETVRRWVLKFGPMFAHNLRRLRPRPTGTWHLDEMVVSIQGKRMYLWRAVDSEGEVLDLLAQSKRDTKAALRLMRKLLKRQGYAPDQLVTDELDSYGAARRGLWPRVVSVVPPRAGLAQEQPSGELPSAGVTPRAEAATLEVDWVSSAAPVHFRRGPKHVQPSKPSHLAPHTSDLTGRGKASVAYRDGCGLTNPIIRPFL